jgi:hypothetical protein
MACFSALCKLLSLMLGSSAWKMGSQTRLVFLPGSSAVFSSSQTRPWLVFRCYVNFFLSRSGPAREKWALGSGLSSFPGLAQENQALEPDLSSFPGLAQEKWAPRPGLSSFSGLTWRFLSLRPDGGLFLALCKLLSLALGSSARKMGSQTRLVFFFGSNVAFSFSQTRP